MPKTNIDYSKTVIYKIVCNDENVDYIYVGSTTDFTKRKSRHKYDCNKENSTTYNNKKYIQIRENGGWENFKMIEIEKYPCNDNREAEAREEEIRKNLRANANMRRCYITREEALGDMKIRNIEYYKHNSENIKNSSKIYYQTNKEKIKNRNSIKHICECGKNYSHQNKSRHNKSKFHQNYIKTINN